MQVRPRDLLEALEDALISLPGNEHVLSDKRMELHGAMDKDKAAAQELVGKAKASIQTALAGGKLTGRLIYADHNRVSGERGCERERVRVGVMVRGEWERE